MDLFASRESTTHYPFWFAWTQGDAPLEQDALVHKWPNAILYVVPPLPLILTTLQQVSQRRHQEEMVHMRHRCTCNMDASGGGYLPGVQTGDMILSPT